MIALAAEIVVALLLLASGVAAVVAASGLARLPDFFLRMHAPAICYTLGTWSVALASVVHFSAGSGRLTTHVWLIAVILAITTPVTTVLLSRAALFRARRAQEPMPPPLAGVESSPPAGDGRVE